MEDYSKSGIADLQKDAAQGISLYGAEALRAQLEDILGSPHFRNSKRCQALLRFVVESAATGQTELLKERTLGVKVFGREPAYDTAQDAIVRNAAVEVRKRLAQYYLENGPSAGLRIELPAGSYVPAFPAWPSAPAAAPAEPAPATPEPVRWRSHLRHALVAGPLLCAAGLALWFALRPPASALDRFWEPLLRDREVVQVCAGQPRSLYRIAGPRREEVNRVLLQANGKLDPPEPKPLPDPRISPSELLWVGSNYLYTRDAFSMMKLAALLQAKGAAYQLRPVSGTTYSHLRRSPMVTVGAFNNQWAMRLSKDFRFFFDHKTVNGSLYNCITDRRNPGATKWMLLSDLGAQTVEDFAIVTRVLDPETERTVVMVAGIDDYGTLAAGEFVTEAAYMKAAVQGAPKDWHRKNIQIVLKTKVIEGTPGPATVLATHFW